MDNKVFDEIFNAYYKPIISFIYGYIGSFEESKDLTQDVFVSVFKNYEKLKEKEKIKSWIFKIAANKSVSFLRWRKIRNFLSLDSIEEEKGEDYLKNLIDESQSAEEFIVKNEFIKKILKKLSDKERMILLLRAQGFSVKDISSIRNISESTVKVHIFNAKNKLKDDLEGL